MGSEPQPKADRSRYMQVVISAEMLSQAYAILDKLIEKRLVNGGPIFSGPAKFIWKNRVVEHNYCYVHAITRADLRDEVIRTTERQSVEEICMISFSPFDGSPAYMKLLDEIFNDREDLPPPVPFDGLAAVRFIDAHAVGQRTVDSFGDLSGPLTNGVLD